MSIALPSLPGLGDGAVAPTPYASPASQEAQRAYAKALMFGSVGKDGPQFPVVQSWTQGASNMVNALMGGLAAHDADAKDRARYQTAIPEQSVKSTSFSEGPSSEGQKNADDDMSKQADAIASIESKGSGDYSAVGPATRTGDRAYGKYQVMGANIPSWTKEVLGKEMSPQEFLSNQAAQDAVFKTKFPQGGGNDADRASVWFTGKPLAQGGNRSDGYITGNQYVDKFNKAMGAPSSQPMSFAGPDNGSSANPAVAAMSAALQGKPPVQVAENGFQPAASKTVAPNNLPQPNSNGTYYDPRLIKPPPQYSADQVRAIMASPELSLETKSTAMQAYRQQGQPIELPYPGGHVVIDPRNPTRQQFIPDLQKGTTKIGDVETPSYGVVGPAGTAGPNMQNYPIQRAPVAPVGPQSSIAPQAAPVVAPQAAPVATPAPGPVVAQNAPPAPATPPQAPVQVASADPVAAFAAAAGKPELSPIEQQMMAMAGSKQPVTGPGPAAAPPQAPADEPKPEVIPVASKQTPAQAASPLAKMASNDEAIRNLVGPDVYDAYKQKKDADVTRSLGEDAAKAKIEVDKEAQNDSNKLATKKYDTLSTQGQAARKLMPNIDMGLALLNDPRFHSGIMAAPQDVVSRLKASLFGDDKANAPNEVFDKLMAGTVLDTMKTALSGLGQVRLAEIGLLTKANANRTNSPASNRAVLEISRRGLQSIDHLDDLGQQYTSGDEVRDPVDGKVLLPANIKNGEIAPRHGLDVGYDKLARKFVLDHPTFTPEEVKNYEAIFDAGKDQPASETKAAPTTGGFATPPAEAIQHLKENPATRGAFEKHFGPADQYLK